MDGGRDPLPHRLPAGRPRHHRLLTPDEARAFARDLADTLHESEPVYGG
ncbi:hypothetical protein ACFQ60_06780 [Streptomyces zhihengii]